MPENLVMVEPDRAEKSIGNARIIEKIHAKPACLWISQLCARKEWHRIGNSALDLARQKHIILMYLVSN